MERRNWDTVSFPVSLSQDGLMTDRQIFAASHRETVPSEHTYNKKNDPKYTHTYVNLMISFQLKVQNQVSMFVYDILLKQAVRLSAAAESGSLIPCHTTSLVLIHVTHMHSCYVD